MFMMSELYHLRAINIMAENIKTTVPYISHLIKSYDKHYIYKKQLEPVIAIAEESLISVSEINIIKPQNKKIEIDEDHYYTYNGSHPQSNGYGSNLEGQNQNPDIQILDELSEDEDKDVEKANIRN